MRALTLIVLLVSLGACGDDDTMTAMDATAPPPDSNAGFMDALSPPPDGDRPTDANVVMDALSLPPDGDTPRDANVLMDVGPGGSEASRMADEIVSSFSGLLETMCICPDEGQTTEACIAEQAPSDDASACIEAEITAAGADFPGIDCFTAAFDTAVSCLDGFSECSDAQDGCLAMWFANLMECPEYSDLERVNSCL